MPDIRLDPLEYLAPPTHSFWAWDQDAATLIWRGTLRTIAFRPELEHILRIVVRSDAGLPPLSLVLLVLAACRDTGPESTAEREDRVLRYFATSAGLDQPDVAKMKEGLDKIACLRPALRCSVEGKSQLVQFLFETGGACRFGDQAIAVCDRLANEQEPVRKRFWKQRASQPDLREGFRGLLAGVDRLDEETFQLRSATGLDELPQPAEIAPEQWEQARDLITSLLDDRVHGGLARLARALMAVVHLPRPLLEPEELPMGGFSDIENRGSLDRLLVSELAHDELTLAVRIALNEALYLRRETPPKTPSLARSILIDAGIRMWGVPRVFAAAVAMALVATTDHHTGAMVYRAKGTQIERADLTTRDGLIAHLGALEPDVHPGRALARFLDEMDTTAARSDCIVITSVESADDPQFQQCLARQAHSSIYLATVDRTGEFRLVHQGLHGRKLICEAQLKLDEILSGRRHSTSLIDTAKQQRLPAIFREAMFPLRVPCNRFNDHRSWTVHDQGVFEITGDHRLLLWNSPGQGPLQIAENVPCKMPVCWGDYHAEANRVIAVLGQLGQRYQVLNVDLTDNTVRLTRQELAHPPTDSTYSFCTQQGVLLAIAENEVMVFSRSGAYVTSLSTQGVSANAPMRLRHFHDRFFVEERTNAWYAFSYGTPMQFQMVFDPATDPQVDLVAVFDWIGHEGPVALTRDGQLYYPEERRRQELSNARYLILSVSQVSPCGEWLTVECELGSKSETFLISVSERSVNSYFRRNVAKASGRKWVRLSKGSLHRRFTGVAASDDGSALALVSTKGMAWMIELRDNRLRLRPNVKRAADMEATFCDFDQRVALPNCEYQLHVATGFDGCRVFLDSRGLLHLCSGDGGIPDATLVLADGEIAGWCADGRLWGNPYFIGAPSNCEPREIFEDVIRPFIEVLA